MGRERFSSRLGFILISAGCAIGLGNVWRFPYIVGQYGGAAFVLIYAAFLVLLGLPIIVMEYSVGRASQKSAALSFDVLEPKGTKWHFEKWFAMAGNYVLMMFYTTVAGWLLLYVFKMAKGDFVGLDADGVAGEFGSVLANPGVRVIGKIDDLDTILALNTLDEIAITLSIQEYGKLEKIVAGCEKSGVHTKFIPDYYNFIPTRPFMEDLQGLPVIHIRHVPLTNLLNATMKRTMDLVGGMMALILFSPVMLVTAILIKATSPGPVIFCQERVGLHNKPFKMYKFRSMAVQSAAKEKSQWTTPGDPRVTPIGRFIRKTSIDELPQLFNVLKGDMSLVGPRPERPFFVEKFKEEIPRYMIKHQVRPGMTGWAQVNGYRGDTSITKRIEHDLYYIENWTLGFDFKIMFLTVFKGFINKNAY